MKKRVKKMKKRVKKMKIEKEKVLFSLNKDLIDDFRKLIHKKYDKFERGLFSAEAELCIRHWLSLHTKTQKEIEANLTPNPPSKIILALTEVKNYLLSEYFDTLPPASIVPTVYLKEAIMATRGSDERTIKKWMATFHRMGLIKPITPQAWEIM